MAAFSPKPVRSVLEHVVGFSRALHEADLTVNPGNLLDLCQCFAFIDIARRDDFHAAARATLVARREDIPRFDAVFARYWESPERISIRKKRAGENEQDDEDPASGTKLMLPGEEGGEDGGEAQKSLKLSYSPEEVIAMRDLGTLTDADVERAQRLIREIVAALANKRGRRHVARRSGRVPDLRRLLRSRAFYTADGICALPYRTRRINKTRLVLLCDVSGSMQRYSSFLIEFMYALRRELSDLEVGVFSTHLTMITDLLKAKGVAASLKQVADKVHDWAGGTNIGGSLREFNEQHAPRMLNGHTAVIFLSDGWDRGNAAEMREEMQKLRQHAQKVVWLNPLLGTPGYQPLTQGMLNALPHLDYFLPAHNLQSLSQLAKTLRAIGA
ncbi:carbon monoxide dehydrogenase E protein [Georgfuchsia toluolica]|uniref:Carbon monoxide dehydrogenase E protein n=1 Tax=Georgfuchsia toluolica TaxID=424218 RepID=A0A916J734_9PROT|nr:VWA domain-containing protein [Georgfuchsia toluolica]CAG4883626.1 carbon monoxide dehydrogenase E protein [Georgfuchsia toluolica]